MDLERDLALGWWGDACMCVRVGDTGMVWVWDGVGERTEARYMIRDGRGVKSHERREHVRRSRRGLGIFCLILRFDVEEVSELLLMLLRGEGDIGAVALPPVFPFSWI